MINIRCFLVGVVVAGLMSACSMTSDVASDSFIQKRKYRRGFQISSVHRTNKIAQSKAPLQSVGEYTERDDLAWEPEGTEFKVLQLKELREEEKIAPPLGAAFDTFEGNGSYVKGGRHEPDVNNHLPSSRQIDKEYVGVEEVDLQHKNQQVTPTEDPHTQGIISVVLAAAWWVVFGGLPIINIIMPIIGIRFGKAAIEGGEESLGKIGKILGIIEMIVGIFITLLWIGFITMIILLSQVA